MIAELPAIVGTMTVRNQREAIALERMIRHHVFAWWLELDIFSRPSLTTLRLRQLEQAVRDAEWAQDWEGVERGWQRWMTTIREVRS
jgi:hypothetical protein